MNMLKGALIGVATLIPGVSGGTMAVILGLYDRLIESISQFLSLRSKWRQYARFLCTLVAGAIIGALLLARLIEWALINHEQLTFLFFMGLIFGSLPYVIRLKPLKIFRIGEMLGLVISLTLVPALDVYMSSERIAEFYTHSSQPFILFISSVVAGGAMIVPGISGALVYLLFDQYSLVVHSVNNLDLFPLILIVFGGILGIIVFAKIIYQALDRWPSKTHSIIIGLVIGSLFVLFKGFPPSIQGTILGIVFFLIGAILSSSIYNRRS
ncbi:DUF368 domain-containing protein [[Eubacterium] cellulosolvens]